jgi:hypothetical protein
MPYQKAKRVRQQERKSMPDETGFFEAVKEEEIEQNTPMPEVESGNDIILSQTNPKVFESQDEAVANEQVALQGEDKEFSPESFLMRGTGGLNQAQPNMFSLSKKEDGSNINH